MKNYVILERINIELVEKGEIDVGYIIVQHKTETNIDYTEMEKIINCWEIEFIPHLLFYYY